MNLLKKALLGAAISFGLFASSANAATYNISFTENNVGDSGPDWFGSFEAPSSGGLLTSFTATISGVLYDRVTFVGYPGLAPVYDAANNFILDDYAGYGFGVVGSGPDVGEVLALFIGQPIGSLTNPWFRSACGGSFCGGGVFAGTYSISAVSEVPIPAALPLLAAGVGAMGFTGWRRKRKASAIALHPALI